MRKFILGGLLATTLLAPTPALAHDSGSVPHKDKYLRAKVYDLGASPGRDIVKYGVRSGKKATYGQIRAYFNTMRRMIAPPPAPVAAVAVPGNAPVAASTATSVPVSSGGGGCGDLPAYIVQRESGSQGMSARNGRYGGCAQVDDAHFAAGGTCSGLDYISCVNKLWDGGRGASNWPTAANPPGQ
jgi:hypothetical protein